MHEESILPGYPEKRSEIERLVQQRDYHQDLSYITDNFNQYLRIAREHMDSLPTIRQTIVAYLSNYMQYEILTDSNKDIDEIVMEAASLELPSSSFKHGKKDYD